MLKFQCKHCATINERDYGDIYASLKGNHFYKLRCSQCNKRTLFTYKIEGVAVDDTKKTKTTQEIREQVIFK